MKLTAKHRAALDLLVGCPGGVTADMLAHHGHIPQTLRTLAARKFIAAKQETLVVPQGMTITRYRITPLGRAARAKPK